MKHTFVLLVVAIYGSPVPVLAQKVLAKIADPPATDLCRGSAAPSACPGGVEAGSPTGTCANRSGEEPRGLLAVLCESQAGADDRTYLLETATSSATLTRQGPEIAIARLNPRFAARLASAIREARGSGLPSAGIFSAYRPPAFGVGRFLDKFMSLHPYGLAVDMFGIGQPHSKEAKLWYEIAGRHGIVCPYGVASKREWNHCQATPIKVVCPDNPLRKTITAEGPIDLEEMFKVGDWFVDNAPAATCIEVVADRPAESKAIRVHAAPTLLVAAIARSDRKHLRQAPPASVATSAPADRRHLREARNLAGGAVTRARTRNDDELTRMVAADLRLGEAHRNARPRR